MKIEFYEPPMCCPTGICGPSVDEKLVKLVENIDTLKKKYTGLEIERYMMTQQPSKFKENDSVYKLVKEQGKDVLPIATFNGEVIKTGGYPTLDEMEKIIQKS
ncbi:arsenite efflux transporter metallochaperone ArsD [Desulforamulus aquiferis]|uniref:Arsenite efflux transporter metallochaperone ArsD n=1 Tax=Desulforamulus aquiferis TaxID=1397668 RepID=A0AAW7ZA71_9FIRM|nr:arsenite efflux transporter metallochaperone ArsD [Desulforamulus aquiferis]MDO7786608.1 arsenite efflux transporter metallochaperone ArsD [Desulforamulus aquiferis]RYD05809.1 arsenic resistance operon repressor [Desulforamulus aquiferis]